MTQKIEKAKQADYTAKTQTRPTQITIKKGDTVSSLAIKYGMSKNDFMEWAGLKNTNLQAGQKLTVPTDTVPPGQGILALAKKYNMTLDEFCKLNNITKNYQPSKGEVFYVRQKKASTTSAQTQQTQTSTKPAEQTSQNNPTPETSKPKSTVQEPSPVQQNKTKWGSSFTPQEIATKLNKLINKWQRNSVGKQNFQDMLNEINPKNVQEVITEYQKLTGKQSLINDITHEVTVAKDTRKSAVMHIFNALAKAKGASEETKTKFQELLDKEFDSWGMVNTKGMDEIITKLINSDPEVIAKTTTSSGKITDDKTKLTVKNGTFTAAELQRGAIASAKKEAEAKYKEFCKQNNIKYNPADLDLSPLDRIPAPIHNGSTITSYNSGLLKPTGKPNGKVVILNPGHGGYSSKSGYFDVGAYSFIKKGNGKYAPMLEYEKMKDYAQKTADALRAQGYAVVIANSHVDTMSSENLITNLISSLNNGKMGGTKYDMKNISFISLHADSEPGKSGSGICFDPNSATDVKFKDSLSKSLNSEDWISAKDSERTDLHVIKKTDSIPSVLLEVEYVNGSKSQNLDSSEYQRRFIRSIITGLNNYYGAN